MKKYIFLLLTLCALFSCSSPSKEETEETEEEEEIKTIEMSHQINNGYNSHLSYVSSGYEFAVDGGLKLWYTLRNSDTVDYTEARVNARIEYDRSFDNKSCSLGIFKRILKVGESFTYSFYILKSDIEKTTSISIKINSTSCYTSDLDLFRPDGIVETYSMTLLKEINTLNVYEMIATYLTSNNFLSYRRSIIYCYADVIDVDGNLLTWILLKGEPETEYIQNNQRIELKTDFNLLKTSAAIFAGVIFTSSFA